jgi:hypothetical protein
MLHRNMNALPLYLQLGLEDLLGDLRHARRTADLGRLALLTYCEVRRWARLAGDHGLAEHSASLFSETPLARREDFLNQVDVLIAELDQINTQFGVSRSTATGDPGSLAHA